MHIRVGNNSVQVTEYDSKGQQYRKNYEGFRITTIVLPDGLRLSDAFHNAVAAIKLHLQPDTKPVWIDTERDLELLLVDNYGIEENDDLKNKEI
jgi:hypothetical protein